MCLTGDIIEQIIFEYIDEEGIYEEILSDEDLRQEELKKIRRNMQAFLDEEIVKINGVEVRPMVFHVDIGLAGSINRPFIKYLIRFAGDFKEDLNIYENIYEPEEAEYNYSVIWVFPEGARIVDVDVGVTYFVGPSNILRFYVRKGFKTSGVERISFVLSGVPSSSTGEVS